MQVGWLKLSHKDSDKVINIFVFFSVNGKIVLPLHAET